MAKNWTLEDIERIETPLDRDEWLSPDQQERIRVARLSAFKTHRRLSQPISRLKGDKKRSVVGANRWAVELGRKTVNAARKRSVKPSSEHLTPTLFTSRYAQSILLNGLVPDRRKNWVSVATRLKTRVRDEIDVTDFSFLTHPVRTMAMFAKIAEAESKALAVRVNFDDPKCTDIGPWLLLSVMRQKMAPIFTGGRMENSLSKVISELQLDTALRMQVSPLFSDEKEIWAFPVQRRREAGSSSKDNNFHLPPQKAEKVGDELCAAVNVWIDECVGQELTRSGRNLVKKIVGESLDNAERHSRPEHENDGDWMTSGFMARRQRDDGKSLFRCHLAFLSVGSSVAETVATCDPKIRQQMDNYCNMHRSSLKGMKFADEHLRTVFALQDTVTRDRTATAERRGGTGFGDVIHFFGDLAGSDGQTSDATLAVVSGRTCIHIGFPHVDNVGPILGKPRNIWLNDENSSKVPPDQKNVFELENDFCGTLITMGFTLDPDYLERTINGPDRPSKTHQG